MIRFARTAAVLLTAPVILLSGCGGPSEGDRKICSDAAKIDFGGGLFYEQQAAPGILNTLSGYAPENDRLVRAVNNARDDARALASSRSQNETEGNAGALSGSLSAIQDICKDLGG